MTNTTYDTLYLCEKPSQARALARQLGANQNEDGVFTGGGAVVLNAYGHLLNLAMPDEYSDHDRGPWRLSNLPIVPKKWKWKVKEEHLQHYAKIGAWLDRVKTVVIATDPDEEGEVIGRQILYELGFKGNILRLWASALNSSSLNQALKNLLPLSATDTTYRAGCVRRQLDWLYGINLSRAFSVSSGQRTSIGRVKTRLLTELVNREKEIKCFTPKPHFTATAKFRDVVLEWQPADWNRDFRQLPPEGEVSGICIAASEFQEILNPPLPLTLSALLANAADIGIDLPSGYAAVQKLYEVGAISYPRTGSTEMPGAGTGFAAHHAIIHMMDSCPSWMPGECQTIFKIVHHNCMLQQIGEATLKVRKLLFDIGGEMFSATDYWADPFKPHDEAWLLCEPDKLDTLERNVKTVMFKPGDQVNATLQVERTQTVPPKRYTEADLLRHMAEAGIGTEATRVDAINSLVKDQVAERTQVRTGCSLELKPTEKGMHLIDRLPPSVTGHTMDNQLRNALNYVRTGQVDFAGHILNASKWISHTINGINNVSNQS
jgi:DNA topoisomerase III